MITRPHGMGLVDWTDQVILDLDRYGAFSKIVDGDWQGWGVQFMNNGPLGRAIPNPYGFDNWIDWAERFCIIQA